MKIIDGIELVTFDLDGTLIDDEWAHRKAKEEIARSIGAHGDLNMDYYIGRSNRKFWKHVIDDCGGQGDIEALVALQFDKVLQYIMEVKQPESDGISEAVRYFKSKGIKVAITSGSDLSFIDGVLEHLHLSGCFDTKICKDYVKQVKPAPDIYLAAQRLSGISGRHAVGIEDLTPAVRLSTQPVCAV